jgi:hypothetical protein
MFRFPFTFRGSRAEGKRRREWTRRRASTTIYRVRRPYYREIHAMGRAAMLALLTGTLAAIGAAPLKPTEAADLVKRLRAVGTEGAGNVEAAKAWQQLTAGGPESLPIILGGMDGASPIGANWLRSAAYAAADNATAERPLPVMELTTFLDEKAHNPAARRIAYELLVRADSKTPERLLPNMLLDPSHEIRRDAVAHAMGLGKKAVEGGDRETAKRHYQNALKGAVDQDQMDALVKALKPLGVDVDVATHLGFIRHWHIATPFDNTEMGGFRVDYAPEKEVDLKAAYKGKGGAEVKWRAVSTTDAYGKVDLNKEIDKLKGVIAYAHAVVDSPETRPVEIRAGSFNAVKIFLNGKEIFFREEYHHGMQLDQHIGRGMLKKGKNEILIKVCQNEQTDSWAQSWIYQARITDAVGQAVPFTQVK